MRPAIARLTASTLVIGLVVTGAAVAQGSPERRPLAVPQLSWHPCQTTFRCADLKVPLDYARPAGASLELALVELPATGSHVIGDLVLNPGGPGASGVQFLEGTGFPAAVRASFNLVSFDPRGVGQSDPVRCVGASGTRALIALDPDPQTPTEIAATVRATKAFDRSCAQHSPRALLENVGTLDTVRDLDRIRSALGQPKLNYLGFSYGTYIGEVYAEHYPGLVRAMVLDGAIDPALSDYAYAAQQAGGFELDLKDFFAWCPGNTACTSELPQGVRPAYKKLFGGLAAGEKDRCRLKTGVRRGQQVTLGVADTALLGSLYSDQGWPYLAQAIQQGLAGDGSLLALLAYSYEGLMPGGSYSNLLDANAAISCVDRPFPTKVSQYQQLAAQLAKTAPDFGALSAWDSFECAYWPVAAQGKPGPVRIAGGPPILVIGSTGDPATPYSWAQAVTLQMAHARLLTRDGPGHTGYLFSACAQRWTDRYLETLALPPVGTVCSSTS